MCCNEAAIIISLYKNFIMKDFPDYDKFSSMNFEYFRENVDSTTTCEVCLAVDGKRMDVNEGYYNLQVTINLKYHSTQPLHILCLPVVLMQIILLPVSMMWH